MSQQPPRTARLMIATTGEEARSALAAARKQGQRIGLVPTMGALHEGHLSLVRAARRQCDFTVATIFVNPTQFGPREDLDQYPRTFDDDLAALSAHGVDLLFAPAPDVMYPPGFSTAVEPPDVARPLEGECRPGHFRGVATIVLKLLNLLPADVAYFGQKDYQQSLVIRRLVEDLNLPIEIRVCPTVREADGLAMSSRNRYLSAQQRERALSLWRSLQLAGQLAAGGQRDADAVEQQMQRVLQQAPVDHIDYAVLADPETLERASTIELPVMALVAARFGQTRLIDNLRID